MRKLPLRLTWWRYWPGALIGLVCTIGLVGLARLERAQAQARAETEVHEALSAARSRLDAVTETTFGGTAVLESLLQVQGTLDKASFDTTVALMRRAPGPLRNVVAAPDDVVALVHPLKGNERALGLNYRSVPAQWAQIERARQLKTPLIFAPVSLVQGGLGVIQRRPVFLGDGHGGERYWGSLSAVADLERYIQAAQLEGGPVLFALHERRGDGQLGAPIWGPPAIAQGQHLREDLKLPGATWVLIGRPRGDWVGPWWQGSWLRAGVPMALLLVALSSMLTRRRLQLVQRGEALEAEVAARRISQAETEAARARMQALLATASDWYWEQDAELRLSYVEGADASAPLADQLRNYLGLLRWEQQHLVPGLPGEALWAAHRAKLARHEPFRDFEYAIQRPGQALLWLSVSGDPVFDEEGRFQGYRGTGREVTALRALRQNLAETHDHLQAVLDSASEVAIIATDLEDRITDFNRGAELMLGYGPQEVMGSSPRRFHDTEEVAQRATELSIQLGRPVAMREVFTLSPDGGPPAARVWTYLRRDGTRLPVSLTVNELRDRQGALRGHLGIAVSLSAERAAQEALRGTAQRLQAVLDSAEGVAIVVVDPQGHVEIFNRAAERMLGCSAAEVIGRPARRFHLESEIREAAQRLGAELGRPVRNHEVFTRQAAGLDGGHTRLWTYVRVSDGQQLKVSHTFSALHDAQGRLSGYLALARDVTEQLAAEAAKRSNAAQLQGVLDAAEEIAVMLIDRDGRIALFNRGAERMTGYRADAMLGEPPTPLFEHRELAQRAMVLGSELGRPVQPEEVLALQAGAAAEQRTQLWTLLSRDGQRLRVSLTVAEVRDSQGSLLGHVGIGRDVTADLSHEQALRDARDRLQAVLDAALDVGILVVDLKGRVQLFSKGAERMFGYLAHEVIGRSTLQFHDLGELTARAEAASRQRGRRVHKHELLVDPLEHGESSSLSQWTYVRKSGKRFHGALRFSRMPERDGRPTGFLAMTMDIGAEVRAQQALETLNLELEQRVQARTQELARAQEELLRSERLAALGSMVAGVAHDLNTPLGTCMTAASTLHERTKELREELQGGQLRRSRLESYVGNSEAMSELLLRGLRDAADLVAHFKQLSIDQTSEHRRKFQLATVVADVLTVMRPQLKQGQLTIETDLQLEELVDGYPGELGRLLTNLIQNTQLHAFAPGEPGRLLISARPLEAGWFELVIADDGKGMSDDVRRRAFDPFFTTKLGRGGSGLGLNIVHTIATALLGGSVELQSSPGQGSRFIFRLPLQAPKREPTASRPIEL